MGIIDPYVARNETAAEELARRIFTEFLPRLGQDMGLLMELAEIFQENDVEGEITAAEEAGTTLAGYSTAAWRETREANAAILQFLQTPLPVSGKTPRQIVRTRYVRESGQ